MIEIYRVLLDRGTEDSGASEPSVMIDFRSESDALAHAEEWMRANPPAAWGLPSVTVCKLVGNLTYLTVHPDARGARGWTTLAFSWSWWDGAWMVGAGKRRLAKRAA